MRLGASRICQDFRTFAVEEAAASPVLIDDPWDWVPMWWRSQCYHAVAFAIDETGLMHSGMLGRLLRGPIACSARDVDHQTSDVGTKHLPCELAG